VQLGQRKQLTPTEEEEEREEQSSGEVLKRIAGTQLWKRVIT